MQINRDTLTALVSGYDRFGRLTRFARSSLVDSDHSEFISRALMQILNGECRVRRRIIINFQPFAATFASFHIVT